MENICKVVGNLELSKARKIKVLMGTINHFKKDKVKNCNDFFKISISYTITNGMCYVISERLKKFNGCHGITKGTIDFYIPEFTRENAKLVCEKYNISGFLGGVYWFGFRNFDSRIELLEALIAEIKNK